MTDWKEMYLTLFRDVERAVRILTEAQQKCEELYLSASGDEEEDDSGDGEGDSPGSGRT